MKIKEAVDWGTKQLKYSSSPRLDAEVLLSFASQKPKTDLYARPFAIIPTLRTKKYKALIKERAASVPIAYLTKQKEFFNITFYVDHHVLIPRPETEAIVKNAIELARKKKIKIIYDIGTGCGNIAIALAKNLPSAKIVASDICRQALSVAKRNILNQGLENQIEIVHSNLAEHIKTAELIVANLPYIPEYYRVSKDILFEPQKALFAGMDGLKFYRRLFKETFPRLFRGTVLIELGTKQYEPMSNWLIQHFSNVQTTPINNIDGSICGLKANFS
ncbi:peptide chain release factor N(5)-glutamine methyltransferase [candidate division Kazan bacterium]|uniref:peptide chain release factor N(5)-glutamine methyltransferase n=1 Tax=candidate division Kazan bacterium TaxID=2202143 RepID=A0A420ZCU9_UNCK3|nr:MAG: peptide chain release factor N(5)-glutamine methyltransferase [candidate division Kazan bacterium]